MSLLDKLFFVQRGIMQLVLILSVERQKESEGLVGWPGWRGLCFTNFHQERKNKRKIQRGVQWKYFS